VNNVEPAAAVVRRVLPASPDVVYDEWLDADALTEWMCPYPARATKIELDPRIGGHLRIDIDDGGLMFYVTGRYLNLDRPRRLVFTWKCSLWAPSDRDSVVTVTLEPQDDRHTLMTIHHALLPPELIGDHQRGWTRIAEQLDDILRASR
jgi:uncharacterized protein YndB with AHSA1/START domain